jgi:nucleotide-binding universal stress UspA family protein
MKVLLAIDQIHADSKTLKLAKKCLETVDGSELTILYVSNQSAAVYYRTPVGTQNIVNEKEWEYINHLEATALHEFRPLAGRVRFQHAIGNPAKVICEVARELNADLVIIGSAQHRVGGPKIGSVVKSVLNQMDRPVLAAN